MAKEFANLTPEQLAAWKKSAYYNNDYAMESNNARSLANEGGEGGGGLQGSSGFTGDDLGGNMRPTYDAQGNFTGVKHFPRWNFMKDFAIPAAVTVGGTILGAGVLNGALAGGAASGAVGADAATSAAWGSGAGLGGDTLGAMGMAPELAAGTAGSSGALVGEGLGAFAPTEAAGSSLVGNGMGAFAPGTEVFTVGEGAANSAGGLLGSTAGKIAGAAAGGLLGSQPTTSSTNSQSKIDPRMEKYLYGDGNTQGILDQAYQWQQANKSGLNDQMRQGLASINRVASDPSGYQAIQQQGLSLMNQPVAGNPFSNGQATLQTGTPQALRNLGFK